MYLIGGDSSGGSPFVSLLHTNVSCPPSMRSSDVSFSPKGSLQSNFISSLKRASVQSKELRKVFEDCTKKVVAITKDYEMMLHAKENTLAEEILQVTVVTFTCACTYVDSTHHTQVIHNFLLPTSIHKIHTHKARPPARETQLLPPTGTQVQSR